LNNLPGGSDLLAIARDMLMRELLPLAADDAKYSLLMVANAIAIASRELAMGHTAEVAALARLDILYGTLPREITGTALRDAIAQYDRRLAQDIRAGRFDADDERQRALLEHLQENVAVRLRISNPRSLSR
jgi:uncharacterized protein DUF6285